MVRKILLLTNLKKCYTINEIIGVFLNLIRKSVKIRYSHLYCETDENMQSHWNIKYFGKDMSRMKLVRRLAL